jgi:acyl-CoA synthetase (AMP-forming)/AMP-acid ligase II
MHLSSLVEMVESGLADRVLLGGGDAAVTGAQLGHLARRCASLIEDRAAVVYVGENHPLLPVVLLAAASAGVPFAPINYRLDDWALNALVARQPGALVLADASIVPRISARQSVMTLDDWLVQARSEEQFVGGVSDDDAVAVVLSTSGTTSEPRSALLRHRHLMAYLLNSIEFGSADQRDAALIAVPPYHVAGVASMLSNLFAGRRLVYLRSFDPGAWLDTVRAEGITNAMVVPTMLARIVDHLDGRQADVPTLRSLAYGGAKVSERVLVEALHLFPDTGFVNAYGLTETASTIALLGPAEHRAAVGSDDPDARRRLWSAGQVLAAVEVEIRDELDRPLPPGETGLVHVRGDQISGEYASGSLLDDEGWFCTRDLGWVDGDGYLFIDGRADDTIIRGGENIAPTEIEDVIRKHPDVADVCVVGIADDEWGQRIAAVVVLGDGATIREEELIASVRRELRSSKAPERIVFRDRLPYTETGKLLRRTVLADLERSIAT